MKSLALAFSLFLFGVVCASEFFRLLDFRNGCYERGGDIGGALVSGYTCHVETAANYQLVSEN